MAVDLVIRGGSVIDGTGSLAFTADIAVEGDRTMGQKRRLLRETYK